MWTLWNRTAARSWSGSLAGSLKRRPVAKRFVGVTVCCLVCTWLGLPAVATAWDGGAAHGFHYYQGPCWSGSSQRIGLFTYYDFNNGCSGDSFHGDSQQIGNFSYYNFRSGDGGDTWRGSSQRIGGFTYYDFYNDATGDSWHGSAYEIGDATSSDW